MAVVPRALHVVTEEEAKGHFDLDSLSSASSDTVVGERQQTALSAELEGLKGETHEHLAKAHEDEGAMVEVEDKQVFTLPQDASNSTLMRLLCTSPNHLAYFKPMYIQPACLPQAQA